MHLGGEGEHGKHQDVQISFLLWFILPVISHFCLLFFSQWYLLPKNTVSCHNLLLQIMVITERIKPYLSSLLSVTQLICWLRIAQSSYILCHCILMHYLVRIFSETDKICNSAVNGKWANSVYENKNL